MFWIAFCCNCHFDGLCFCGSGPGTIVIGTVGGGNTLEWPLYIA
jgi:hypothetical protein